MTIPSIKKIFSLLMAVSIVVYSYPGNAVAKENSKEEQFRRASDWVNSFKDLNSLIQFLDVVASPAETKGLKRLLVVGKVSGTDPLPVIRQEDGYIYAEGIKKALFAVDLTSGTYSKMATSWKYDPKQPMAQNFREFIRTVRHESALRTKKNAGFLRETFFQITGLFSSSDALAAEEEKPLSDTELRAAIIQMIKDTMKDQGYDVNDATLMQKIASVLIPVFFVAAAFAGFSFLGGVLTLASVAALGETAALGLIVRTGAVIIGALMTSPLATSTYADQKKIHAIPDHFDCSEEGLNLMVSRLSLADEKEAKKNLKSLCANGPLLSQINEKMKALNKKSKAGEIAFKNETTNHPVNATTAPNFVEGAQ